MSAAGVVRRTNGRRFIGRSVWFAREARRT